VENQEQVRLKVAVKCGDFVLRSNVGWKIVPQAFTGNCERMPSKPLLTCSFVVCQTQTPSKRRMDKPTRDLSLFPFVCSFIYLSVVSCQGVQPMGEGSAMLHRTLREGEKKSAINQ